MLSKSKLKLTMVRNGSGRPNQNRTVRGYVEPRTAFRSGSGWCESRGPNHGEPDQKSSSNRGSGPDRGSTICHLYYPNASSWCALPTRLSSQTRWGRILMLLALLHYHQHHPPPILAINTGILHPLQHRSPLSYMGPSTGPRITALQQFWMPLLSLNTCLPPTPSLSICAHFPIPKAHCPPPTPSISICAHFPKHAVHHPLLSASLCHDPQWRGLWGCWKPPWNTAFNTVFKWLMYLGWGNKPNDRSMWMWSGKDAYKVC